jgi:uncharacterized protein (TIGR02677 family)
MARRRSDAQPLLRYATGHEHAPVYRAIMELFTEAAAGYASRLRVEDVHAALVARLAEYDESDLPSVAEVAQRLKQLFDWGNLTQDNDTSRATNLDRYGAVAYVCDLTTGGEAAQDALVALEDGLRRVGGLQAVALRQIEELVGRLAELVGSDQPDGDEVYVCCEDLHSRFRSLTANAALFMQKVNKLLGSPVVNGEEFALFKADTIAYLNDFLADLDTLSMDIRGCLDALNGYGADALQRALSAGERSSGEFAPLSDETNPSWALVAQTHLAGIESWFRAGTDAGTGALVLYSKARDAILGITRVAERIRESAESPTSRASDLLNLAARFEACVDDASAHSLWHAAFGLSSSRHLGMTSDDSTPASTSWWDPNSRVVISKNLRISGRTDYVRRATNVRDRSEQKRYLARAAAAEQRITLASADALVALGDVLVSDINARYGGPLDPATLKLLAGLLARAQRARLRPDGTRHGTSVNGALLITIGDDLRRAARIEATTGTWTVPDRRLRVERTAVVREMQRVAADRPGSEIESVASRSNAADVPADGPR